MHDTNTTHLYIIKYFLTEFLLIISRTFLFIVENIGWYFYCHTTCKREHNCYFTFLAVTKLKFVRSLKIFVVNTNYLMNFNKYKKIRQLDENY